MARMNFAVQLSGNKVPGVMAEQTAASALGSPEFLKR
jgi:precorrin-3B methylase